MIESVLNTPALHMVDFYAFSYILRVSLSAEEAPSRVRSRHVDGCNDLEQGKKQCASIRREVYWSMISLDGDCVLN